MVWNIMAPVNGMSYLPSQVTRLSAIPVTVFSFGVGSAHMLYGQSRTFSGVVPSAGSIKSLSPVSNVIDYGTYQAKLVAAWSMSVGQTVKAGDQISCTLTLQFVKVDPNIPDPGGSMGLNVAAKVTVDTGAWAGVRAAFDGGSWMDFALSDKNYPWGGTMYKYYDLAFSPLAVGQHTVLIQVANIQGSWSNMYSSTFTIVSPIGPAPPILQPSNNTIVAGTLVAGTAALVIGLRKKL